jgi:hypothetical protein
MGRRGKAMVAGALLTGVGAAAGWILHGESAPVAAARAQSVSVLQEADVGVADIGRLAGTSVVYVEFADGARCLVADNGAGEVDCDWAAGRR